MRGNDGMGGSEIRSSDDHVVCCLPQSGLRVYPDRIVRSDERGETLFSVPIASLSAVEYRRPLSSLAVIVLITAAGFAGVALFVSSSTVLSGILGVLAVVAMMFGIMGLRDDQVVFTTATGEFEVICPESASDVRTFTVAVREFLAKGKT
jgi:hypothetical protein